MSRAAPCPGYDLIVQAISGLMSLTGPADGEPYRAGISVFDVMAGLHATIGLLAALHRREETGRGQHVEVNLLSSALSGMVNHTSAYVAAGVVPYRMGNSHPSLFPYEPLPCSDGELIVTAGNDQQFRKLVDVLGVPELADDPRFARNPDRTARRDELRPLLVERLSTRTTMEWFRDITAAGIPCGPINTVDQGVAFAEDIGLDPVVDVGPDGASVRSVRNPITLSETPPAYRLPPPALDEHGDRDPPLAGRGGLTHDRTAAAADLARHLRRRPDPAARPGPHRRPHGPGRVRRAGLLAGGPAAADAVGGPGLRGGARRAGRPRVHATAIAARLTYLSAPDSVQGALAAGLLGGGSRFLGVTEDCGQFLDAVIVDVEGDLPTDDAGWDALALAAVTRTREAGRFVPGLGHPVHKVEDPRTPVLLRIAEEEGLRGPHLRLFEAVGRVHEQVLGRRLPLNGAGVCGAALADLGLPVELLRGFALLARAAGLLGQLAEERRRPVGMDVYLAVDRGAYYVPPDQT